MINQLVLFQKMYDFILYIYPIIDRIPKSHRLVLGREIEKLSIKILLLIIKANQKSVDDRHFIQEKISTKVNALRILFRLTKDLKFISINQYELLSKKLNEIGKFLYCWSKI